MDQTPKKKKSGRSCFLYGCLTVIVVFVAAIIVMYLGVRYYVNSAIQQFTEATPTQFEPVTLTDDENKALQDRLKNFNQDLQDTNKSAQITLDSRELNALMAKDPKLSKFADNMRVKLDGDQALCQVSMPTDPLANLPFFGRLFLSAAKGRYLNGTAKVRVSLESGKLTTKITGVSVKKEELPSEALSAIEQNPGWQQFQQSPEIKKLTSKIDWLKIVDGKVELGTGKPAP